MSVQYRLLHPHEQAAALDLWVEVFPGTDRTQWEREFVWDPQRFTHTHVVIAADGTLLATARYFVRDVRGTAGERYRAGWLTNVATKPNAQRQGYGGQLLARTLQAMQQDGCVWSLLTADSAVQGFYARHGLRAFPLRYQQDAFTAKDIDRTQHYHIRRYDPDTETSGWDALAAVYDAYNAARPLTIVRDHAYWQTYGRMRLREWLLHAHATIWIAEPVNQPGKLVGYLLTHLSEMGLLITEAGTHIQHDAALAALLQAVIDRMVEQGLPAQGRVHLPHDMLTDDLLQRLFGNTLHSGADAVIMARGISERISEQTIDAIFTAPTAIWWPLDDY